MLRATVADAPLSPEEFAERLARLCLQGGAWEFPKHTRDRHILLKSMQLQFEKPATYTEPEVNGRLQAWMTEVAPGLESDVANLRRNLVDFGYLTRDLDGRAYRVGANGLDFSDSVDRLRPADILHAARAEREERRQQQLKRKRSEAS